jgi:hypothetical protein
MVAVMEGFAPVDREEQLDRKMHSTKQKLISLFILLSSCMAPIPVP